MTQPETSVPESDWPLLPPGLLHALLPRLLDLALSSLTYEGTVVNVDAYQDDKKLAFEVSLLDGSLHYDGRPEPLKVLDTLDLRKATPSFSVEQQATTAHKFTFWLEESQLVFEGLVTRVSAGEAGADTNYRLGPRDG